ncbi:MAG: DUF4878 domain-containing protein [Bacteroidetes bacterium]|nr:DUF4878 domain-containing protein [Bacteroidota bacterium]
MKYFLFVLSVCTLLSACHGGATLHKAADAEEAAREFVRASLNGEYDNALFYLYKDSLNVNQMILDKWKSNYDRLPNEDKVNFKSASIIVKSLDKVNDSVSLYNYYNSYKKKDQTIKIIRINGEWLVDLKDAFTHSGSNDAILMQDSLHMTADSLSNVATPAADSSKK